MGNENSKDGEVAEQQEAEGPSASEGEAAKLSKLPNGDVGTSSGKADESPEGQTTEDGEDPREPTDVDEHTKRMTIIRENVYHYVGLVAGREYAREKGLAPKNDVDLPVAPLGFLRPPDKKIEDAAANDGKIQSKPGKEVDSPSMEIPRFYQPPGDGKNKATEKLGMSPDANDDVRSKDEVREKDGKEKVGKTESKPEVESLDMELPRFYQTTDKDKTPRESSDKAEGKTQVNDNKEVVEREENVQAVGRSDKSGLKSLPNGKAEDRTVEKPSKGDLQSRPEKEAHTPATKIPRFYQKPNEDKEKASGELDKSDSKDVSNGTRESKAKEESKKVDEIDLPHFYQSPSQNESRTTGKPTDKSESKNVTNGDTHAKTDEKNGKLENEPVKKLEVDLPRFYSAEEKSETESGLTAERHTTALTVGPRSRRTEESERKGFVAKNSIFVGRTKRDENQVKPQEQEVEERTVLKEEVTSYKMDNQGSPESANDLEPYATELKPREKKEKVVRFEDSVVEKATTSPTEKKRVTSMMFVAPVRNTKSVEPTLYPAPVELTSALPPTAAEASAANDDDALCDEEDDPIPMCGDELIRAYERFRGFHSDDDDTMAACNPENEQKPHACNYDKYPTTESEYDDPYPVEDILTPISASSLYSSSTVPNQDSLERIHDVEEGAADYNVVHLRQPGPRSPEVDLGHGKILNAPSILMGSSIITSTNRQKCEVLPQEIQDNGGSVSGSVKVKPVSKKVRIEPSRHVVSQSTGTASSPESDGASIADEVHASVEHLVSDEPDSGTSRRDSCTQTSDETRDSEPIVTPPFVRSRSVGFQCGTGVQRRTIATTLQKQPSLPSDSRPARPPEIEKKTRIPLTVRTAHPATKPAQPDAVAPRPEPRSAQTEPRRGKGSPLPERKISVLRRDAPTTKSSPRAPPATNDPGNHRELGKRSSLPPQNSPACSEHPPTTSRFGLASPRIVRKKENCGKSPLHKTNSSSKSMDCIPRCTCLQLSGKDGDKTTPTSPSRHPSNPLGLREYGFNPPSKKPIWR